MTQNNQTNDAIRKLTYGLFVLTARSGEKDNGCIVNTVAQLTSAPNRILVSVNRKSYTHDLIQESGCFNASILHEQAPFSLFQRFGFQSGRQTDKFAGLPALPRSKNGLLYLTKCANAVLSGEVTDALEFDTHTLFVAKLTEALALSDVPSMTYRDYFTRVKPSQPTQPAQEKKTGYICNVCGYILEESLLPPFFICPVCGHGASDFSKLE